MVSPHVARGRRNLAANMIPLMRHIGMDAFQTVLLPGLPARDIQLLNQLNWRTLEDKQIPVQQEIERAIAVSLPIITKQEWRIHFAGDLLEVMLNLLQWNRDMAATGGAEQWGRRTITYFVFNPQSGDFAPSKYCAYVPVTLGGMHSEEAGSISARPLMTMSLYAKLDGTERCFDGAAARIHLTQRLGMVPRVPDQASELNAAFKRWLDQHDGAVTVHPSGPVFLTPPDWFK